ncbi:MAG: hypothetical protein P4L84_05975 [Isosphaeraceae bacterium]|nr:hypothetical protein [Isosphaeraceae bacterium]
MAEQHPVVERPAERVQETDEFRRSHYRAYDEDGFVKAFAVPAPECATLDSVTAYLCAKFAGTGGTGFDSKDMVVLLGPRIVAVIRKQKDGEPHAITFAD